MLNYACSTLIGEFQYQNDREDKHTPVPSGHPLLIEGNVVSLLAMTEEPFAFVTRSACSAIKLSVFICANLWKSVVFSFFFARFVVQFRFLNSQF